MNKTIQITLTLESGRDNFDVCEAVEQVLLNSSLNNSELKLVVQEVKVTKSDNIPTTMRTSNFQSEV